MKSEKYINYMQCIFCDKSKLKWMGEFIHCENCKNVYPIVNDVPDFTKREEMIKGQKDILSYYENESSKYNFSHGSSLPGTEYNIEKYYSKIFNRYIDANKEVIEIGCGTGRFSLLLKNNVKNIISCDFSMPMIQQGLNNAHFHVCADSQNLPFKKNIFDLCIGVTTFSYIPNKMHSLISIKNVLNNNGKIILIDMNRKSPVFLLSRMVYGKLRDKNHQTWVLNESNLQHTKNLLTDVGFKIIEENTMSFVPHVSPKWFIKAFGIFDKMLSHNKLLKKYAMRYYVVAEK